MLCQTCKRIFADKLEMNSDDDDKPHHPDIVALHRSAEEHCQICVQLFINLLRHYWNTFTSDSTLSVAEKEQTMITEMMESYPENRESPLIPVDKYLLTYELVKLSGLTEQEELARELTFYTEGRHFDTSRNTSGIVPEAYFQCFVTLPSERVQEYTLTPRYVFADRSDYTSRLNLAKGWLQDCLLNHTECRKDNLNWLPTRLLRIYGSGASSIKLILTKLEPPTEHSSPYLTLSHCWGKVRFFTLTTHTLPQLLAGLDVSILPKTFQDAIKTTAFLGFQYLWIDSLCIMQGLIEDWQVESALMGDVYSNGVCNLAATGSDNRNGSFWVNPQHSFNLECLVDQSSQVLDSHLSWHTHPMYLQDASLLLDGPLLSRGWVIQERILARRALHFGASQLFWECRHFQACETYPKGLPRTMQTAQSNLLPLKSLQEAFCSGSRAIILSDENVNSCWVETVNWYSNCNLTKADDKLVAIAGLAKKIQERHPNISFLAGMVRQALKSSLLWRATRKKTRPTSYRAPSWSWSSVESGIEMYEGTHIKNETWSRIVEVDVAPGDDPLGQNVSATLRMEAYLTTLNVRFISAPRWASSEICINGVWNRETKRSGLLEKLRDADEPFRNLHCLVMFGGDPSTKDLWFRGVLIQPTGVKEGQFRRYGVYMFRGKDYKLSTLDDLKNVRNEEWLEYETVGEDGKYIVSIV